MYQKEAGKHAAALTCSMVVTIKGIVQCEDDACQCGVMGHIINVECHESDYVSLFCVPACLSLPFSFSLSRLSLKCWHDQIADLGLATDLQSSTGDKCWGTDSHKPPEAFRTDIPNSVKIVTPEYDVYSFGMTLYELLTGIHPYSGEGFDMMKILKVDSQTTSLSGSVPKNTHKNLISIMERSWSYEPKNRPNFKGLFIADLPCMQC
nr:ankyrin repeat and protein kinase domain-containing protein 1-like [Lytechinus pictus]